MKQAYLRDSQQENQGHLFLKGSLCLLISTRAAHADFWVMTGWLALTVSGQPTAASTRLLPRACPKWTSVPSYHLWTSQVNKFSPGPRHLPWFSSCWLIRPFPQIIKKQRSWAKPSGTTTERICLEFSFAPLKILGFSFTDSFTLKNLLWKFKSFSPSHHIDLHVIFIKKFVHVVGCNPGLCRDNTTNTEYLMMTVLGQSLWKFQNILRITENLQTLQGLLMGASCLVCVAVINSMTKST